MRSHLSYGYRFIYKPEHPNSNSQGYIQEHRIVMEQYLGRYLRLEERIHHINKNRADNRIENLELYETESDHAKHEYKLGTYIGKCNTGKPLSEEHKQKLRMAFMGLKNPFYGKKHTKKTKNILSQLAKKKIGKLNPNYGKKHPGLHKGWRRDKYGKWIKTNH